MPCLPHLLMVQQRPPRTCMGRAVVLSFHSKRHPNSLTEFMMPGQGHPEDFVPQEPIILIYIGRSVGNDLSQVYAADVYAAVKGYWPGSVEPSEANNELILARNTERILGAFRAKRWVSNPFGGGRWGFVGESAELSVQLHYVGKRVPNAYRGRGNPIRYIGFE